MADVLEAVRPGDYLTRLAASDLGKAYKALVLRAMDVPVGGVVVDLGCGPGADLVAFAAAVGSAGRVLGVDHDAGAVAAAQDATTRVGQVHVTRGDVHHLDLADRSVDRVHADRVLQHVADPEAVVGEAARVLRPGGLAALAEPDWGTLVVDYQDAGVPDRYRRFVTERVVRNARVGRRLPGYCQRQGLSVLRVIPVTAVFRDVAEADRVFGFQRVTGRAVDAGYLTAAESTAWLEHLRRGPFFASVSIFVTVAQASAG